MVVVQPKNHSTGSKPPVRKTLVAAAVTLTVALTGTAGWIVLKQHRQAKIQQSVTLLSEACRTNFTTNPQVLNTAQTKVNQATQILSKIPQVPGIRKPAAQTVLTPFTQCLQDLSDTQNFFAAQKLSKAALAIDGQTIHPIAAWRSLQSDLEKAIALLKPISSNSAIFPQAQSVLARSQIQLTEIQNRMQYEQDAVNAFAQAEADQREADRILQTASQPDQFAAAEAKIQQAIGWLQIIPPGHTVSEASRARLVQHQEQLKQVQYRHAVSHLQPLLEQFKAFAQFADALDVQSEAEFHAYFDKIHTLQNEFNAIVKPSEPLQMHPATESLQSALTGYHDVSKLWHQCHTGQCYNAWAAGMVINTRDATIDLRPAWWVPALYQLEGDTQSLATKYELTITANLVGTQYLQVNTAIAAICQQAEQRVQQAEQQLQEN